MFKKMLIELIDKRIENALEQESRRHFEALQTASEARGGSFKAPTYEDQK